MTQLMNLGVYWTAETRRAVASLVLACLHRVAVLSNCANRISYATTGLDVVPTRLIHFPAFRCDGCRMFPGVLHIMPEWSQVVVMLWRLLRLAGGSDRGYRGLFSQRLLPGFKMKSLFAGTA